MMNMEYAKLNKLNSLYNKQLLHSMYSHLKIRDNSEKTGVYDPMLKENIELSRSKLFLRCWAFYFSKLNPLLKEMPREKRILLIHLIFGNAIHKLELLWFSWPSLLKFAKEDLDEKLEIHIKIITDKITYEIN